MGTSQSKNEKERDQSRKYKFVDDGGTHGDVSKRSSGTAADEDALTFLNSLDLLRTFLQTKPDDCKLGESIPATFVFGFGVVNTNLVPAILALSLLTGTRTAPTIRPSSTSQNGIS